MLALVARAVGAMPGAHFVKLHESLPEAVNLLAVDCMLSAGVSCLTDKPSFGAAAYNSSPRLCCRAALTVGYPFWRVVGGGMRCVVGE